MTQDILILLLALPLCSTDATALFQACLSSEILGSKDNGVQKRGYKILAKLADSGKVAIDAENILGRLDELAEGLSPAAKKVRLCIDLQIVRSLLI
jgi:ribosomal RNA-processing protein 12